MCNSPIAPNNAGGEHKKLIPKIEISIDSVWHARDHLLAFKKFSPDSSF